MKTFALVIVSAAVAFAPAAAQAGGWGGSSRGSLIDVSPDVDLGNVNVLNGSAILSGNGILSGNATGILNGSLNDVANGTLNNLNIGIFGNKSGKRH